VFDQLGLAGALQINHQVPVVWGSLDSLGVQAVMVLPSGKCIAAGSGAEAPPAKAAQVPEGAPAWSLWVPGHHTTPDAVAEPCDVPLRRVSTV
jgi:hypothetical protein